MARFPDDTLDFLWLPLAAETINPATTLDGAITDSDDEIQVASIIKLLAPTGAQWAYLRIGSELILYDLTDAGPPPKVGATGTNPVTRGALGTSASAHATGATIASEPAGLLYNRIVDELVAISPHLRKHNFAATAAPGVGDDADDGYHEGSLWVDVNNDKAYVCVDDAAGAAIWTEITGAGGGGGLNNVVEDTTPQLGGNLDLNGKRVVWATNTETLSASKTIAATDEEHHFLDPNGADRDVTLPAVSDGLRFFIVNVADATGEDLVVKNSGGTEVRTLQRNEAIWLVSDGSNWFWLESTGGKV